MTDAEDAMPEYESDWEFDGGFFDEESDIVYDVDEQDFWDTGDDW
jgi:hypothetical protein